METPMWTVEFENDEDDEASDLNINFEIAGLKIEFTFGDAHKFSVQDYQDFGDGKRNTLTFRDSNGYTAFTRDADHVWFHNDAFVNSACVRVPIAKCGDLFSALVTCRRGCSVSPPVLFRTIEGLVKVEFVEGCIVAHHTPKNMYGQVVSKMSWQLTGVNKSHQEAILNMSRGGVGSSDGTSVEIAKGCQQVGTVLRSDGVHLFIGAEAKGPADFLPHALPLEKCSEMLTKIAASL